MESLTRYIVACGGARRGILHLLQAIKVSGTLLPKRRHKTSRPPQGQSLPAPLDLGVNLGQERRVAPPASPKRAAPSASIFSTAGRQAPGSGKTNSSEGHDGRMPDRDVVVAAPTRLALWARFL